MSEKTDLPRVTLWQGALRPQHCAGCGQPLDAGYAIDGRPYCGAPCGRDAIETARKGWRPLRIDA